MVPQLQLNTGDDIGTMIEPPAPCQPRPLADRLPVRFKNNEISRAPPLHTRRIGRYARIANALGPLGRHRKTTDSGMLTTEFAQL
jgi:hypothetical protein